ncbi:hypothetical protein RRG08_033796 [Elysia crispata]|uniref:Uncharacterized protein n=1 Tax=Elysia crispata TaxID=231223 RepID=A0AAE1BA27_9GAST|nr:hypothetical protein RRG08_033796 [Elysia crispata]
MRRVGDLSKERVKNRSPRPALDPDTIKRKTFGASNGMVDIPLQLYGIEVNIAWDKEEKKCVNDRIGVWEETQALRLVPSPLLSLASEWTSGDVSLHPHGSGRPSPLLGVDRLSTMSIVQPVSTRGPVVTRRCLMSGGPSPVTDGDPIKPNIDA